MELDIIRPPQQFAPHPLSDLPVIMAVAIRLRQEGSKGRPVFRIVAADQRYKRDGRFIEILGTYDPGKEKNNAVVNLERVDAWIAQGAQPTPTVRSLIKKVKAASAEK